MSEHDEVGTRHTSTQQATIGVFPPAALAKRRRLFAALSAALPLRFEPCAGGGDGGHSGRVGFFETPDEESIDAVASGPPLLALPDGEMSASPTRRGVVEIHAHPSVPAVFHGQSLQEDGTPLAASIRAGPGDVVLASMDDTPVWTLRQGSATATTQVSSGLVPELLHDEPLRARLTTGRFLGLLALVHFLRQAVSDGLWSPPALRASFVLDDPNLHHDTYGYVRFSEIARHAQEHRYHLAIATIPLDCWMVRERLARLFRDNTTVLSLLIHGNDHTRRELSRAVGRNASLGVIGQALRRIERFERRTGIGVSKVMVPPRNDPVSSETLDAMMLLGIEAVCAAPRGIVGRSDPEEQRLVGWRPADLMGGGLPTLRRSVFSSADDALFQAYLGQPMILYGHHDVFAGGADALAPIAQRLNRIGKVRWLSLEDIARSNYESRRLGSRLAVRPFSRRVSVDLPEGIDELTIVLPDPGVAAGTSSVLCHDDRGRLLPSSAADAAESVNAGSLSVPVRGVRSVELVIRPHATVELASVPRRRPGAWPLARRLMTATRDRALPLLRGAR